MESVYAWFLAIDQNAPRIEPRMDEARKEPPGETRPGTKFYFMGRGREVPVTFTDLEQNQRIDFGLKIGQPTKKRPRFRRRETKRECTGPRPPDSGQTQPLSLHASATRETATRYAPSRL